LIRFAQCEVDGDDGADHAIGEMRLHSDSMRRALAKRPLRGGFSICRSAVTYQAIVAACCVAWSKLIAASNRIRSIATRD
jgi:hypothetical protein